MSGRPDSIRNLDVVALLENLPGDGLLRGQVGTVVEILTPDNFLVEFSDHRGHTYALLELRTDQLMVLRYEQLPASKAD